MKIDYDKGAFTVCEETKPFDFGEQTDVLVTITRKTWSNAPGHQCLVIDGAHLSVDEVRDILRHALEYYTFEQYGFGRGDNEDRSFDSNNNPYTSSEEKNKRSVTHSHFEQLAGMNVEVPSYGSDA